MVAYTKPQQRKKEEAKAKGGREIRSSLLIMPGFHINVRQPATVAATICVSISISKVPVIDSRQSQAIAGNRRQSQAIAGNRRQSQAIAGNLRIPHGYMETRLHKERRSIACTNFDASSVYFL